MGVGLLTSVPHAHGIVVAENIGRDLLFGLVTAGAALLPDSDHPQASFAHSAGPLSHGISHVVAVLFGGHRYGMHSFFGIGLMALVTEALGVWLYPSHIALGILAALLAMCTAAGLAATGFARHGLEALLLGCGVAAVAVVYARPDLWWLVAMGMALHILEDEFSGHGCALFWPISRKRVGGDGHQPAGDRKRPPGRSGSSRRPTSGYHKAKARAARGPVAPKPSSRPARGPSKPACPLCWVGDCGACTDRGCGCPERVHPARPKRNAAAAPEPVTLPWPDDDVPPF